MKEVVFDGVCTIGVVVVGISWALGSILGRHARLSSSPVSIKSAASLEARWRKLREKLYNGQAARAQLNNIPCSKCPSSRQCSASSPQYPAHPHPGSTSHMPFLSRQVCTHLVSQPYLSHSHLSPKTYLTSVLIFTQSTSYNFFRASLICLLFALTSQINTSVLFSSIFFIALSVFRGLIMTL